MAHLSMKRYTGTYWYYRKKLARSQWFSPEDIEELQLKSLKAMIQYASKHVPYYHSLMSQYGITASDITTLDDIKKFPILNKDKILDSEYSLVSSKIPKVFLRKAYTGGTTGTPLKIFRSLSSIGCEHAFVRRQFDWAGISTSDRTAYLSGRIIVPPDQDKGKFYTYDPVMKELILSTYHLSENASAQYLKAMKAYDVKAIVGYPSAIFFMAKICIDMGITMQLKAALTSAETLTHSMRKTISEAFHCPVYDFLGSAERVCYIFTCEKGNYHLQPEYGYTELIPTDEKNTFKIISTGFWNKAMPFIRYDMGDTVKLMDQGCACGRTFPIVASILGRRADTIKTPTGREFGAAVLTHLLYGTDHILESQIIQDEIDHLFIDYVPNKMFSDKDKESFSKLIKQHLPSDLRVDFRARDIIPRTASGKIKAIVSLIK